MIFKKELELELEDDNPAKGNKLILCVYFLFCLSIACICTPILKVHTLGSVMLIATLFIAWILRFGRKHDTLIYNHMIYISRTIWMLSFILTVTVAIAGYAVSTMADNSIMRTAFDSMMEGHVPSNEALADTLMEYLKANFKLMLSAALFCAVPTLIYTLYRLKGGISRALKGYRLQKPESWF